MEKNKREMLKVWGSRRVSRFREHFDEDSYAMDAEAAENNATGSQDAA